MRAGGEERDYSKALLPPTKGIMALEGKPQYTERVYNKPKQPTHTHTYTHSQAHKLITAKSQ